MSEKEWLSMEGTGADAKRDVPAVLSYVFSMQIEFVMGIITGLYLNESDWAEIANQLTQDDPVEGSVGRYRRYPVYNAEAFPKGDEYSLAYDGVAFTYCQMLDFH